MKDLNEAFVHLNVGLPDDVERLKAAGYYKEAVARIDEYLAEDWTETQNSPHSQGLEMPEYEQPANPVPHGVDALRDALLVQKEIRRCRNGKGRAQHHGPDHHEGSAQQPGHQELRLLHLLAG